MEGKRRECLAVFPEGKVKPRSRSRDSEKENTGGRTQIAEGAVGWAFGLNREKCASEAIREAVGPGAGERRGTNGVGGNKPTGQRTVGRLQGAFAGGEEPDRVPAFRRNEVAAKLGWCRRAAGDKKPKRRGWCWGVDRFARKKMPFPCSRRLRKELRKVPNGWTLPFGAA